MRTKNNLPQINKDTLPFIKAYSAPKLSIIILFEYILEW